MKIGRLLLRLVVGGLFVGHGTQKLFGWWNGPGLDGATGMMKSLELEPARQNAVLASATEAAGGAMLVAGAATPLAATGLIAGMITAIRKVHFRNGLWNGNGGYEFNLLLIAALVYLAETGPGCASIDHAVGCECGHRARGLLALAAGAIASTVVIERGRRLARELPAEAPAEPAASTPPAAEPSERPEPPAESARADDSPDESSGPPAPAAEDQA